MFANHLNLGPWDDAHCNAYKTPGGIQHNPYSWPPSVVDTEIVVPKVLNMPSLPQDLGQLVSDRSSLFLLHSRSKRIVRVSEWSMRPQIQ